MAETTLTSGDGGSCAAVSLHDGDDVAVLVSAGHTGETCTVALADSGAQSLALTTDVPFGHKVALRAISKGEAVTKYGVPIGRATEAIAAGAHVHVHNLAGFKSELSGGQHS